jgi:ElaB/YqjD/DUF883 family membrane-anchored ribosome-binding protein
MYDRIKLSDATLESEAAQLKEKALELEAAARERLGDVKQTVEKYIAAQPARALMLAFGMGILLGWLIKRR